MSSTIKLSQTISLASKYIYNSPLLYTNDGELAFRAGDFVRQFILSPPFAWRWNRGFAEPIQTVIGQTDYTISVSDFGWLEKAYITFPSTGLFTTDIQIASRSSNVVTLQLGTNPQILGFSTGQIVTVADVTDSSFEGYQKFYVTELGSNTIQYAQVGPDATSMGGKLSYLIPSTSNTLQTKELEVKPNLAVESVLGLPAFICPIGDDNNGTITFRLMPAPDQVYTLGINYQRSAPTFSKLSDTWSPIPDYLSYLYTSGFISMAYEYKGDERFAYSRQQFFRQVLAASDGVEDSIKNIFLEPKLIADRQAQNIQQMGTLARQGRIS